MRDYGICIICEEKKLENIFNLLDSDIYLTHDQSFSLSIKCANLLSSENANDEIEARKIIIHVLDKWERIPKETYPIWNDIIESVGFYPYLKKNVEKCDDKSLADEIRINSFKSDYLKDIYLHKHQKTLSNLLMQEKNVVASAPTSFGKSILIEEIVASKIYRNIVIIQPTLALLDETRIKLKKYNSQYKIIVRTSQIPAEDKGNLFLLTAERVMEYELLPPIDLLIIDEFYKISLKRVDERADILNNAFLKIVNKYNSKFYFLGPNIDGITEGFEQRYNAIFFKSKFSLVDCNVKDLSGQFDYTKNQRALDKDRLPVLFELLDNLKESQTIIYCSSPSRTRNFAKKYYEHLVKIGDDEIEKVPLIEWIENNISDNWSLVKELKYGVAIHDGSLQKHIGASIIKYFNEGRLRCIFCTSTIIEGVNTSAKNVILFDGKKGTNNIDFFDYSNIKGRSGRMMEHFVGCIYNFVPIPQEKAMIVDIPFFEQNEKFLTDEILVNIKEVDVQSQVLSRYNELNNIEPELLKIIKKNGTKVEGQIRIYKELERDIFSENYYNIAWTKIPSWDNIQYILKLAQNNTFNFKGEYVVFSVAQLTRYINIYRNKKNIMSIIADLYKNDWDKAIEQAFHLYRKWFQFVVPKAFRVVDNLQRYVCEKYNKKPGSYSYFIQQLENDFLDENLSILLEYGIPNDTIRHIAESIPHDLNEDEVVEYIKENMDSISEKLIPYEKERLIQCL